MSDPRGKAGLGEALSAEAIGARCGDRVVFFDAGGVVRYCNDAYAAAIGRKSHEVLGSTLAELCETAPRLLIHSLIKPDWPNLRNTSTIQFDQHLARWTITRVLPSRDGLVAISEDADTDLVRQHQIARQVTHDDQTGLPNLEALRQELAGGEPPYELVALEVEHVARIAEAVGPEAASLMMVGIADNIDAALRADERLFRTRSAEFVILRSVATLESASRAQAYIDAVQRPILAFSHSFRPRAHVGAVTVTADSTLEPSVILRQLDLATAAARKSHDCQPIWFKPAMEASLRLDELLSAELRHGIESGQLLPYYQPITCLRSGAVMGVEALVRWMHPNLGVVEADDVMRLARIKGLAARIDNLVLDAVTQAVVVWRKQSINLSVSLNFTCETLGDPFLAEKIASRCKVAGADPAFLEIEVPEAFLLGDESVTHARLRALSHLGIRLSIDDFGSGAATTATLLGAPIDSVKIDWQAARRMANEPDRRAKAFRTLARMAQTLGFAVVAKGIETAEEETLVRSQRIMLAQGFRYAHALSVTDVPEFVRSKGAAPPAISAFSI